MRKLRLMPGMSVAVYSPKGKKFRGRAVITSVSDKTIFFKDLSFKIRRGDRLMLAQSIAGHFPYWNTADPPGLERF